jgi:hypothetical protein
LAVNREKYKPKSITFCCWRCWVAVALIATAVVTCGPLVGAVVLLRLLAWLLHGYQIDSLSILELRCELHDPIQIMGLSDGGGTVVGAFTFTGNLVTP